MNLENCIVDGFKTMKDGSLKITLITRELPPEQLVEIIINLNKEVEQITVPNDTGETKSKSTRLRNVLYRVYESDLKKQGQFSTFEIYYASVFERLIDMYKEKIINE